MVLERSNRCHTCFPQQSSHDRDMAAKHLPGAQAIPTRNSGPAEHAPEKRALGHTVIMSPHIDSGRSRGCGRSIYATELKNFFDLNET